MHEYDKSSKWLIQHHGDSILRMAGIVGIESWRPLQAEVVQPRQLPDGLIEALSKDNWSRVSSSSSLRPIPNRASPNRSSAT